jgi:hypothetical protein
VVELLSAVSDEPPQAPKRRAERTRTKWMLFFMGRWSYRIGSTRSLPALPFAPTHRVRTRLEHDDVAVFSGHEELHVDRVRVARPAGLEVLVEHAEHVRQVQQVELGQ